MRYFNWHAERYAIQFGPVVKIFRHKGLQAFFDTGSKAGIQPHHAARLGRQLARLDLAKTTADINVPGWGLHALTGNLAGHYSVSVSGNWRLTFGFDGGAEMLCSSIAKITTRRNDT